MYVLRPHFFARLSVRNQGVRLIPTVQRPVQGSTVFSYRTSIILNDRYGDSWKSTTSDRGSFQRRGLPRRSSGPITREKLSYLHSTEDDKEVDTWRAKNEITVSGKLPPPPIMTFSDAPFSEMIVNKLSSIYSNPLPIQSQGWSVAMSGNNMVGCADTGSGKTVAFLLPAFEHIKLQGENGGDPRALILAPTRELAQQIEEEAKKFARFYNVKLACIFGGAGNRSHQRSQLHRGPGLIVACPGRLLDFVAAGDTTLENIDFLVLDEADRMLDMGFEDSIREIISYLPNERQTCMWSATWPKEVARLSRDYLKEHIRVNVGSQELSANPNVKQVIECVTGREKMYRTIDILKENASAKVLVFAGTKAGCEDVGRMLYEENFSVATLHGDKSQQQRNAVVSDFKANVLKIVVATDVAARGLDVKDIELVINFDFPQEIENYIHRIGRTARAGQKGTAISFFTDNDGKLAQKLLSLLDGAGQEVSSELRGRLGSYGSPRGGGGGGGGRGRRGGGSGSFRQGGFGQSSGANRRDSYGDSFGNTKSNRNSGGGGIWGGSQPSQKHSNPWKITSKEKSSGLFGNQSDDYYSNNTVPKRRRAKKSSVHDDYGEDHVWSAKDFNW